jgi:hypothetical protein
MWCAVALALLHALEKAMVTVRGTRSSVMETHQLAPTLSQAFAIALTNKWNGCSAYPDCLADLVRYSSKSPFLPNNTH